MQEEGAEREELRWVRRRRGSSRRPRLARIHLNNDNRGVQAEVKAKWIC
jgi:predicted alpha/beta-hydrolase family hydrolase